MRFYDGADGLKTGFTDNAGYTMAVTAKRDDMRLIAIVLGESVSKVRNEETTELLDYGFNTYKIDLIKGKGEVVDTVNIDKSNKDNVNIITKDDISILNKKTDASINYDTKVKINEIKLPIKKGDIVGKLDVLYNDKIIKSTDLIIDDDVDKINYFVYLYNNIKDVINGNLF